VPVGLLGKLDQEKAGIEAEVRKIQSAIEEADARRLAARAALSALLRGADPAARERLLDLVERKVVGDSDVDLQAFGVGALGGAPGERAAGLLRVALSHPDVRVVVGALDALGDRDDPDAVQILATKLYDSRWPVRASSAASLGRSGRATAVPPLIEALATAKGRDLDDLQGALRALTGRDFAAAADPWKAWWAVAGAGFRGPKEAPQGAPPPDAPGSPAPAGPEADLAGGTSFYGIQTHSTRVLFVLDVSGSMNFPGSKSDAARKKIDVLREEVRRAITGLQDGSVFDIVLFSSSVRVWKKDPQVRGAKALSEALEFVNKAEVVGSTNVHDALETAFKMMGAGTTKDKAAEPVYDTLFFMTDGRPTSGKVTDPQLILGAVRRWNEGRKVRVHVVGAGGKKPEGAATPAVDDVDPAFLKALAEQNGGEFVLR
jgi:uncharacterized protein YegL